MVTYCNLRQGKDKLVRVSTHSCIMKEKFLQRAINYELTLFLEEKKCRQDVKLIFGWHDRQWCFFFPCLGAKIGVQPRWMSFLHTDTKCSIWKEKLCEPIFHSVNGCKQYWKTAFNLWLLLLQLEIDASCGLFTTSTLGCTKWKMFQFSLYNFLLLCILNSYLGKKCSGVKKPSCFKFSRVIRKGKSAGKGVKFRSYEASDMSEII